MKRPGIEGTFAVTGLNLLTGTNQTNAAVIFLPLKHFAERNGKPEQSAKAISAYLNEQYSHIQEAFSLVLLPPPVQGIGQAGGFKMQVEDRSGHATPQQLEAATQALIAEASKDPQYCGSVQLVPRERSAVVCERRSRQSQEGKRRGHEYFSGTAGQPGQLLHQRFQLPWAERTR